MAIYDCFQYFDEDNILELRLNILDKYVDYFVISESTKTHQGKSKKINFDINKFKKYPFWRIDKYNQEIIYGGWHFSFLQSPSQILTKIKSFSHGEFNKDGINEKNIEEKILRNEDIFERKNKLKKVTIDNSYPDYIINNKEKLSNWII